MSVKSRWQSAWRMALWHLVATVLLLAVVAILVWGRWYPPPHDVMADGRPLFFLLALGLVVGGPLLTLLLYRPTKPQFQWRVDMALIAVIQLVILAYGLHQLAQSRPVFMAFEGDRFRLVQAGSLSQGQLDQAPPEWANLGYGGPRWLGVRLLANTDPQYSQSIQLAMLGLHPALRPERWQSYDSQRGAVQRALKPVAELRISQPQGAALIDKAVAATGESEDMLGFVPLIHGDDSEWVVLVRRTDAAPLGYVPLSGW